MTHHDSPSSVPTRIGVLGGGQLGRMLALAGAPLGLSFRFLDPDPLCPAAALGEVICGAFDDPAALDRFADGVDLVTFEFENVPAAVVHRLADRVRIAPCAESLRICQDRAFEKRFFEANDIPVEPWAIVDDEASLAAALDRVGVPGVLKTRRLGYDGKGQRVIRSRADAHTAFAELGGAPCTYERFVSFTRELSIVAVRAADGSFANWPISENVHRHGILHTTIAPAAIDATLEVALVRHARRVMEQLDHHGVLTIEFFEIEGRLAANEMAPRVHNSGHWTIDGAVTSQFENHLRAICGLPLGSTAARGHAAMLNLVGEVPPTALLTADPELKVHLYGKSPRPGRKLGHATVVAPTAAAARERLRDLKARLTPEPAPLDDSARSTPSRSQ